MTKAFFATSLAAIFVLISLFVNAQNDVVDIIYLKNGNVLQGQIVEVVPGRSIKINTLDGTTVRLDLDQVDRTAKGSKLDEPALAEAIRLEKANKPKQRESGYIFMLRFGPNLHFFPYESLDASIGIVNAYRVSRHFSVGWVRRLLHLFFTNRQAVW